MAIPKLILTSPSGEVFALFNLVKHPDDAYVEADTYIALTAYPSGTLFSLTQNGVTATFSIQQPVHAGLWAYPGNSDALSRLPERLLLVQESVTRISI